MNDELILCASPTPGVQVWTFNRPDKLNALSTALLHRLDGLLRTAAADGSLRCVILTGAGEKAFVAGADIEEYSQQTREQFVDYQHFSRDLFCRLERLEVPTIAAINGYALGGGFEIGLCCDILIAARHAEMGLPEGRLGLCPGGGGTQRLVRSIGRYASADVLLAARRLSAERAAELGLVTQVVPGAQLMATALEKAAQIATIGPLAARAMKRLLREGMDMPLDEALTIEQAALARLFDSADAGEGVRAFMEKRRPTFTGH
ncbi:MAG: enoyl-CoA hydratase/isomerase family protein [Leptolyngbya sp. PLA3]|nr:MAG: enoyl-CoA hydratase/isomerase family protein [Cyanobacteria bacterium CYA]MCE7968280.1 enoyl-CoA hydratase/isomerase family protein [Leptolyngbya sp. PL-A3]